MTVKSVVHSVDKHNNLQTQTSDLLKHLIVTPAETVAIRQAGKESPIDDDPLTEDSSDGSIGDEGDADVG